MRLSKSYQFVGPAAALFLLAVVAAGPALAANCAKNPSHPSCPDDGGDGSGNEKWPSTLVFTDDGNKMTSDGSGPYVDNTAEGGNIEVFIGSQAKEGDIVMKLLGSGRTIAVDFSMPDIAFPPDPACGAIPTTVGLRHLEVNVSEGPGTQQGVYNLGEAIPSVVVSMRVLLDDAGDLWFLNFGSGERKLCGSGNYPNDLVRVEEPVPGVDEWTVEPSQPQPSYACLEKHGSGKEKTKFCGSYQMPFFFTVTPN